MEPGGEGACGEGIDGRRLASSAPMGIPSTFPFMPFKGPLLGETPSDALAE
jgi:hypothetical protein